MTFSELYQPVPAGQGQPGAPVAQTGQAPAEGAGAPPGGVFGALFPLLLVVPMILVMFFMSRSEQKKQKELQDKLKVGDRVVTQSGLVGKLIEKGERYVKLEIAPGVKVQMLRTVVSGLDSGEEAPAKAEGAASK